LRLIAAPDELADQIGVGQLRRRNFPRDPTALDDEHPIAKCGNEAEVLLD
jgi:hypothetical protein